MILCVLMSNLHELIEMKKIGLALLSSVMFCATAQANITNNAGKEKLENATVSYFAEQYLSIGASKQYLADHQFDVEDINWTKNGNVIHSPIHIPDDQEEADLALPVLFAFNHSDVIVGVGGYIEGDLLKRLSGLSTLKCTQTPLEDLAVERLTVCSHHTAPARTVKQFTDDLTYLMYNSN